MPNEVKIMSKNKMSDEKWAATFNGAGSRKEAARLLYGRATKKNLAKMSVKASALRNKGIELQYFQHQRSTIKAKATVSPAPRVEEEAPTYEQTVADPTISREMATAHQSLQRIYNEYLNARADADALMLLMQEFLAGERTMNDLREALG